MKYNSFFIKIITPEIIGGFIPNLIAFIFFCLLIIIFARTGRMAEMFGWKQKNK